MGYLNEDGLAALVGKVKGQVVQLTAAEYRQIPAETKNTDNKIYFVEDDDYAYAIDNEPTLNSENLVKSGGVYNYTSKIGTGALTTTAQTLIPAVNELKASVDTLNNDLRWKLVGQATGRNNPVSINSLLSTAKEFLIVVAIDNGGNKESILVPMSEVLGNNSWFRAGGYTTASTPVLVTVLINNSVSLINASLGTTDYTSTSVVKVYYR